MQNGGIMDWISSFFTDAKPKPVVLQMPQKIKINDQRKKSLTTGQALNPNTELLTGEYPSNRIYGIVKAAKRYGIDPYTALAIDLQETGLGSRSPGSIGHTLMDFREMIPTKMASEEESDEYDMYARAIATKMQYADKLGIKDPTMRLQVYNGLGKIYPDTEQDYHGFKMKKIYGVPVPKGGIDMRKNPLYGKRILDIRDNILRQNKELDMYMRHIKKGGGSVIDSSIEYDFPVMQNGGGITPAQMQNLMRYMGVRPAAAKQPMTQAQVNSIVNSSRSNAIGATNTRQQAEDKRNTWVQNQVRENQEAAQKRTAERKAATATRNENKPFTFPTGETKMYEDMDWREKAYVAGKNLENVGRINEDEEAWYDEFLNPLNAFGYLSSGLGRAPYEARQQDSYLPYITSVGSTLAAGALGPALPKMPNVNTFRSGINFTNRFGRRNATDNILEVVDPETGISSFTTNRQGKPIASNYGRDANGSFVETDGRRVYELELGPNELAPPPAQINLGQDLSATLDMTTPLQEWRRLYNMGYDQAGINRVLNQRYNYTNYANWNVTNNRDAFSKLSSFLGDKVKTLDQNLGKLLQTNQKPASFDPNEVVNIINENLSKGVGIKKTDLPLEVRLTNSVSNSNSSRPYTGGGVELFPDNNAGQTGTSLFLQTMVQGKPVGSINLIRNMVPYTEPKTLSQILFGNRTKDAAKAWENTIGFKKLGDFPFSNYNSYMNPIQDAAGKTFSGATDFYNLGLSGEFNKAINEALKSKKLGNVLSGGTGHTDLGGARWDKLVNKGLAHHFGNQNGQNFYMLKKSGGPIIDPRGQWAHPGADTIVPTPNGQITMQGVSYPVYGQDETGYGQMMYPGGEYEFPGQMVYERPIMRKGGSIIPQAQWGYSTGDIASLPGVRKQIPLSKEELARNKKAVEERVKAENAKILADRQTRIKASEAAKKKPMSAKTLAEQTQATGDKFRLFPNDPDSFFDEYLNPGVMIGNMASGLGRVPLDIQQGNYGQAALNIAKPLVAGAFAGAGAKSTGQFINNAFNPLAGVGPSGKANAGKNWGNEYFEKLQSKEKELQRLHSRKKITYDDYIKQSQSYKKELQQSLGLNNYLGRGSYGEVFELPNDASKVIKLGNPYGNWWTPELIDDLRTVKQNYNIAIPEKVEYFKMPAMYKGYGPSVREVITMPNLNKTGAENLGLNKRDRYAYFLKQARQLRDKGIKLDLENSDNIKFNKDKGVFDIYDVNPGYIRDPVYYMQYIKDKTRGPLFEHMPYKQGGQHGGLDRWFAEKWVDVKTGKDCGRQEGEKRKGYPACRPSRRVNEDTPKTASELSSSEREKFKRSKTSSERINYQHRRKQYGGENWLERYDDGGTSYTVKSGDTLGKISKQYNVSVKQLAAANNIANPDRISIDQKLIIPTSTKPVYKQEYQNWSDLKSNIDKLNSLPDEQLINQYYSSRPEEGYMVVDKKNARMNYYKGNKLVKSYEVGVGANPGDAQTVTKVGKDGKVDWSAGNQSTGAGVYTVSNIDPASKEYYNLPAFNLKNNQGIEVATTIHGTPMQRRSRFNNNTLADNRMSYGCVNGKCEDLEDMYKYVDLGTQVYVLPEDAGNRFQIVDGKPVLKVSAANRAKYNQYVDKTGKVQKGQGVNQSVNTLNYKPIKAVFDEKKFKENVFSWNDFNDEEEYNQTTKPFYNALVKNKQNVMKAAKIPSDVYNELARMSFGIYGTESNYGDTHSAVGNFGRAVGKYLNKKGSSSPDYKAKATTYGADEENRSVGLTQIRWSYLNDDEKKALAELGITSNKDFMDPEKAAVGTVAILGVRYNQQLDDAQKKDVWTHLPTKWNKRGNYGARVKQNASYLNFKQLDNKLKHGGQTPWLEKYT
jgi:LysM repeat protein